MRNGIFYYQRRVPSDIINDTSAFQAYFGGKALYRKSLGTTDQGKAHLEAALQRANFERLVGLARRVSSAIATSKPPRRELTAEALRDITARYHQSAFRPWAKAHVLAENGGEAAEVLEHMKRERELEAADWRDVYHTPGAPSKHPHYESPADSARREIERSGWDVEPDSQEFAALSAAIRQGTLSGERAVDRLIEGEEVPPAPQRLSPAEIGLTIREAVEKHLSDRSLRAKTVDEIRSSLRIFEDVIGNKSLHSLSRSDFRNYLEYLGKRTVGGRTPESVKRSTSVGTVGKRLGFLRAAINHAIERGWFDGPNPAAGIDASAFASKPDKSVMPDKRGFNVDELNLIFQHPWFVGCRSASEIHEPGSHRLKDSHYWVPIVALLTGCRANELGALMVNEVHLRCAHPHLRIRDNKYGTTKGGYARSVPLLDALLDLGFGEYVDSVAATGSDRIFPDWKPPRRASGFDAADARWSNAGVVRSFNRTVVPRMLKDRMVEGARLEVTFHGFRGAFKAMLGLTRHAVPPNVINEVVGHAKGEMDKRYVGEIPLAETYSAIRQCTFEGLVLPPAPKGSG